MYRSKPEGATFAFLEVAGTSFSKNIIHRQNKSTGAGRELYKIERFETVLLVPSMNCTLCFWRERFRSPSFANNTIAKALAVVSHTDLLRSRKHDIYQMDGLEDYLFGSIYHFVSEVYECVPVETTVCVFGDDCA